MVNRNQLRKWKRMKHESEEILMEQVRQARYTNIFDFLESKE
jgi:hypothetical protein